MMKNKQGKSHKIIPLKSLCDFMGEKEISLKQANVQENLEFLREYNEDNNIGLADDFLIKVARSFSKWEYRRVFTLDCSYETFREKEIWMDYDEMLEMYLGAMVNPGKKEAWWNENHYKYFMENILPRIGKIKY